jgi:hypothetical protein
MSNFVIGQYYKTMIVVKARIVNYDCNLCSKLKCTFTIVNYNCKHL